MNQRLYNYILVITFVTTFVLSLLYIKYGNDEDILNKLNINREENVNENIKEDVNKKTKMEKFKRFLSPAIVMFSFFAGCYFVSLLVIESDKNKSDKYIGIYFLFLIGIILFIMNATILNGENIKEYIKGKNLHMLD